MLFIICGEPVNINSVLVTFKLSLFAINQFLGFCKSEFTAFSISVIEGPEAVRFVSSANSRGLVLLRHSCKSLIYNKESNGPKIERCGTPHLIKCSEETKLFI